MLSIVIFERSCLFQSIFFGYRCFLVFCWVPKHEDIYLCWSGWSSKPSLLIIWASFFFWMQGIMYSRELLIKSRRWTTWYFTVRGGVRRHPRKQRRFLLRRQSCVGRCSFALLRCEGICKLSTSLSMHIRAYIVAGCCWSMCSWWCIQTYIWIW